jgi:DNA-binding NarL/FixJ family response regulator
MAAARIILADDHAIVRAGIRKVVEEMPGVDVVAEAVDGPTLFLQMDAHQPDGLLIDITMPDFNPIKDIQHVRALYPHLKILVVSAYDDDVYVQGLLGAGVNGYHLKDQPLSDLKLAVERVLAGERWISSPLISKLVTPPRPISNANSLTTRQRDLLHLLHNELANLHIAHEMGLSVKTVENHLTRLYKTLNVQSRLEAVNHVNQHPELLGVHGYDAIQSRENTPTGAGRKIAILLVDDNASYLKQLQPTLGKAYPHAVLYEADSLVRAVHLAETLKPLLVFVDVVLGDEDGIRCARRIKNVSPTSRIIMISAYPDREFHRLSLESGALAFLDKKDLDAVTLKHVVDDIVR